MNNIKYRQWLKYGRFHYWGYLKDDVFVAPCGPNDAAAPSEKFTGLRDKNGKEIYEGDVCVFDIFNTLTRYPDLNPFESYLVVIEWKHGAWGFRFLYPELVNEDDREWCAFWNSEDGEMWNLKYFRVIGNIHENPELLESPDA